MNIKIYIVLIILQLLTFGANAQVEYLRLSPAQKITQRIGATDIELEFSRKTNKKIAISYKYF